jgi:hypothetical protein
MYRSQPFLYQGTTSSRIEGTQLVDSSIAQIASIATIGRMAAQKRTNLGNERLRTDRPKSSEMPTIHSELGCGRNVVC